MCTGTGEELKLVWCNEGSQTRVHNVALAVQLSNGQYTDGSNGEFAGGVQLEASKLQFLLFTLMIWC